MEKSELDSKSCEETAPISNFDTLKGRIKEHYEKCSDYYLSLWGEHIHHGYFLKPSDTKEVAQVQLIELLLERSGLAKGSVVLDVGCGVGGTTRYLAKVHGCSATGITISGTQVRMARELAARAEGATEESDYCRLGSGRVRFVELDAEKMDKYFGAPPNEAKFDAVWISEAMSHLSQKELFFQNAFALLQAGGKLVVADWFKSEGLSEKELKADIRPIEGNAFPLGFGPWLIYSDGMLLPPLCTQADYVDLASKAGFTGFSEPFDISEKVAKTWDISVSLVASPSLWALAFSQGRDFVAFLQAFQAMRRGYANGTFRYAVMVFQK